MEIVSQVPVGWIVGALLALTGARTAVSMAIGRRAIAEKPRLTLAGEILESLVIAVVVVFLVIRPFVAQAFHIPSESMDPTLRPNDRIVVNKLAYRLSEPKRHDVVVFRAPGRAGQPSDEEKDFIKRVVGLPGEVIEIHDGAVFINGRKEHIGWLREPIYYEMPPVAVPRGRLFVMGDNRNHSNDSHCWGPLERDRIIGRASFVFWPPGRLGCVR